MHGMDRPVSINIARRDALRLKGEFVNFVGARFVSQRSISFCLLCLNDNDWLVMIISHTICAHVHSCQNTTRDCFSPGRRFLVAQIFIEEIDCNNNNLMLLRTWTLSNYVFKRHVRSNQIIQAEVQILATHAKVNLPKTDM